MIAAAQTILESTMRFARLERILAALCIGLPLLLIAGDGGNVRGSISAYYSMPNPQYFFVPLTVVAMLFVCNGHLLEARAYNSWLGYSLLGVVLFDHQAWAYVHHAFAFAFFGGAAAVMVIYSPDDELLFKWAMCAVIAGSPAAFAFGWISLLLAEWISLTMIAAHYVLESWGIWE